MIVAAIDIVGQYLVIGKQLKSSGKPTLHIRQRKIVGRGKSQYFLAIHNPTFQYISGLFQIKGKENTYSLDYQNKAHSLVMKDTKATIAEAING
jgi:hypothetical protein